MNGHLRRHTLTRKLTGALRAAQTRTDFSEIAVSSSRPHYPHQELTHTIIGGIYGVYGGLGAGLLESVYANALSVRLRRLGLDVAREVPFTVVFDGVEVGHYRADLVCNNAVLVEVKAGEHLSPNAFHQTLNYLRLSKLGVALLVHFGPRLSFQRLAR
ncbi:MAG TPA: GxxExxY protein [Gemmatimonadaceae bacterium]